MLHSFFLRLPSLAGVLLVVLMLEEEIRLGVVEVCHGLGEVVVPGAEAPKAFDARSM